MKTHEKQKAVEPLIPYIGRVVSFEAEGIAPGYNLIVAISMNDDLEVIVTHASATVEVFSPHIGQGCSADNSVESARHWLQKNAI